MVREPIAYPESAVAGTGDPAGNGPAGRPGAPTPPAPPEASVTSPPNRPQSRSNRDKNCLGVWISTPNGFPNTNKSWSFEARIFAPHAKAQAKKGSSSASRLR